MVSALLLLQKLWLDWVVKRVYSDWFQCNCWHFILSIMHNRNVDKIVRCQWSQWSPSSFLFPAAYSFLLSETFVSTATAALCELGESIMYTNICCHECPCHSGFHLWATVILVMVGIEQQYEGRSFIIYRNLDQYVQFLVHNLIRSLVMLYKKAFIHSMSRASIFCTNWVASETGFRRLQGGKGIMYRYTRQLAVFE